MSLSKRNAREALRRIMVMAVRVAWGSPYVEDEFLSRLIKLLTRVYHLPKRANLFEDVKGEQLLRGLGELETWLDQQLETPGRAEEGGNG